MKTAVTPNVSSADLLSCCENRDCGEYKTGKDFGQGLVKTQVLQFQPGYYGGVILRRITHSSHTMICRDGGISNLSALHGEGGLNFYNCLKRLCVATLSLLKLLNCLQDE